MPLAHALLLSASLAGALALVVATVALWRPGGRVLLSQILLAAVALALQSASLVAAGVERGEIPLHGPADGLAFTAWALLVGFLLLQWRARLAALGAFLLPLVVGLDLAALLSGGRGGAAVDPGMAPAWLVLHASLSFMGLATFGVVSALAVMYLVQERSLKRHHASRLGRVLPSLERCDRLIYQALAVGFPLLTLGIFSGLFWLSTRPEPGSLSSAKVVFPLLAWLVFAVVLWARVMAGWRGRKLAWSALGGFLLAMLTFLGIGP